MLDPQIANRLAARAQLRAQLDAEDEMDILGPALEFLEQPRAAIASGIDGMAEGPPIIGIPEYLQEAPVNALDPYAHSESDLSYEGREPSTGDGVPIGLGDIAYYGLLGGLGLLGGTRGNPGQQMNPNVALRMPTTRMDKVDPLYPSLTQRYSDTMLAPGGSGLPPTPIQSQSHLAAFRQHPLHFGADRLYGAGSPYYSNESIRLMSPAAQNMYSQHGYGAWLNPPPLMNVYRTQDLADRSLMLNALTKNPYGLQPFPRIAPPNYARTPGQGAMIGANAGGGIAAGVLLDQLTQGGIASLIPGRKTGHTGGYTLDDIADAAGEGVESVGKWLWDKGKKFTGRG